ncbi:hypothetical protein [Streptomyces mangrovisoli]|uniref:Integral membrane protein n=1 Tax=Streptomyces mangrovisoli TaxID=1428628 RepID=A0A1J4P707_9ACTN|nr:hypothetical protein [Streptomyces mangrovisoli]OIJ69277.1 hypothetical protein WN71_003285 [Streptomyces mangrovisoli]
MSAPHARATRSADGLRTLRAAVFAAVCVVLAAAGHTLASCGTVPLWALGAGFAGTLVVAIPLAGRARALPGIAVLLALGQTVLHTLFGLGQQLASSGTASGGSPGMAGMNMGLTDSTGSGSVTDATLIARAARLLCGTTASAVTPDRARELLTQAHLYDPTTGTLVGGTAGGRTAVAHATLASLLPSLPMLLCHLLAAVAAGWLLRRGDLALLRLIELSATSAHSVAETAAARSLRAALALTRALCAGLPTAPGTGPRPPRTAPLAVPEPRTVALQHTVIRRGPPAAALVLAA